MKKTNTKKNTKKTTKSLVINGLNLATEADARNEYIAAKVRAERPITEEELEFAKHSAEIDGATKMADAAVDAFLSCPCKTFEVKDGEKLIFDEKGNAKIKKANIFRRFWNWIRRK